MSEPVYGTEVVCEMMIADVYTPVLCATDCVFTRVPEFIETTNPTSGLAKDFDVRREEWGITLSGLTKIENGTTLSFFYMLQSSVRRQRQTVRITYTDVDGAAKQIAGNVLIGQQSITGPATDFANCTIEFKGTGPFTITDVEPPAPTDYNIFSDTWATVNGNAFINGASTGLSPSAVANGGPFTLQSTDIVLEVGVEGMEYELVTGSPGNREAQPDLANNKIKVRDAFDGTQRVYVEFKRPI